MPDRKIIHEHPQYGFDKSDIALRTFALRNPTYVFARMGLPPQTGGRITPELVYRATGKTEAERPGLFSAIVRHLEARWMIDDHHDLTGFGDAYKRLSANS